MIRSTWFIVVCIPVYVCDMWMFAYVFVKWHSGNWLLACIFISVLFLPNFPKIPQSGNITIAPVNCHGPATFYVYHVLHITMFYISINKNNILLFAWRTHIIYMKMNNLLNPCGNTNAISIYTYQIQEVFAYLFINNFEFKVLGENRDTYDNLLAFDLIIVENNEKRKHSYI